MVESVDCLSPKLQALVLDDCKVLRDTEVDSLESRSGIAADLAVAKAAGRLGDIGSIEPNFPGGVFDGRIGAWRLDRRTITVGTGEAGRSAGVVVGLRCEGETSMKLKDGVDLPAASDQIGDAGNV